MDWREKEVGLEKNGKKCAGRREQVQVNVSAARKVK